MESGNSSAKFQCPHCLIYFTQRTNRNRHVRKQHMQVNEAGRRNVKRPQQNHIAEDGEVPRKTTRTEVGEERTEVEGERIGGGGGNDGTGEGGGRGIVDDEDDGSGGGRHVKRYQCPHCLVLFKYSSNRARHVEKQHNLLHPVYACSLCPAVFDSVVKLREHRAKHKADTQFAHHNTAFKKGVDHYRKVFPHRQVNTLQEAFVNVSDDLIKLLTHESKMRQSSKFSLVLHVEFVKEVGEGDHVEYMYSEAYFRSTAKELVATTDLQGAIDVARQELDQGIDAYMQNGSGWVVNEILHMDVVFANCGPLNGACNLLKVTSTAQMSKKKWSQQDVEIEQRCFLDAVSYHFVRSHDKQLLKEFADKYFKVNIKMPVEVRDIPRFERENQELDFKINVVAKEDDNVFPIYCSRNMGAKHHITIVLYLLRNQKNSKNGKCRTAENHYAYVDNLETFLRRRKKNSNVSGLKHELRCSNCFAKFTSRSAKRTEVALLKHYDLCLKNEVQAIETPKKGDFLEFKNHVNKFQAHFTGYFDFESIHVSPESYECKECETDSSNDVQGNIVLTCSKHKTRILAEQKPITVSYLIMDKRGKVHYHQTYTGYDCVEWFIKKLLLLEPKLMDELSKNLEMEETEESITTFAAATTCHICEKPLNGDSVRDHDHLTGKFIGAAHNRCNLSRLEKRKVCLYAHK